MEQTETQNMEPKMRLNIKQSAKGQKYYEYTVKADDIEELTVLSEQVKLLAEKTCEVEDANEHNPESG